MNFCRCISQPKKLGRVCEEVTIKGRTDSVRRSLATCGFIVMPPPASADIGGGRRNEMYQYISRQKGNVEMQNWFKEQDMDLPDSWLATTMFLERDTDSAHACTDDRLSCSVSATSPLTS